MSPAARVLANPRAGGGRSRALARLRKRAASLGIDWVEPDGPAAMREAAARGVADGLDRLVIAGGDGALHHVAPELLGSRCALAIIPLGSGNDLARALRIPARADDALELAVDGPLRTLDVGEIDDVPYLTIAGAGLHGAVAAHAQRHGRGLPGPLLYLGATLRALARYRPPRFRIEHDRGVFEGRAWMACVANTPCFGGGMKISPRSDPCDGMLELIVVRAVSRAALLGVLPRVYRGGHLGHPAVLAIPTRGARIATDPAEPLIGDGEIVAPAATAPVRIGVRRDALRVVVGSPA